MQSVNPLTEDVMPELISRQEAAVAQPETLPRLIAQAAAALTGATTAGEILEARDQAAFVYSAAKEMARIAKAKQAHDDIIAACHKAQVDALLIEARAKCRFADEFDAAQARGEVAKQSGGNPQIVPNKNDLPPTAADLGFTGKEIFFARRMRDAEKINPGIVAKTLASGEPTRARLMRAVEEVLRPPPPAQARATVPPREERPRNRELAEEPSNADELPPVDDKSRHDCFLCNGIGTITFGAPSLRAPKEKELDALRTFATFIMANLRDGTLTITGDAKRMQRFSELKERVNPLIPTTARVSDGDLDKMLKGAGCASAD
jgi:hypothetical protein